MITGKFIDERNQDYVIQKDELYNTLEIIESIRKTTNFSDVRLIPVGFLNIVILLGAVYMASAPIPNSKGIFLILQFVLLSAPIMILILLVKGMVVSYHWRKGITDKQILANIQTQGEITTGTITAVKEKTLHFNFNLGNKVKTGTFYTDQWERFVEGDTVVVLYMYNLAYCLL